MSNVLEKDRRRAVEAGIDRYLTKEVFLEQLRALLSAVSTKTSRATRLD